MENKINPSLPSSHPDKSDTISIKSTVGRKKSKKRSKILLIILSIIIVLVTVGLVFFRIMILQQSRASTSLELSNRATEFIDAQQKEENPIWVNLEDEESKQPTSKREAGEVIETECFSLTLPFVTKSHKIETRENGCVFFAGIMSPPSNLAITLYPLSNDDAHINMRRKLTDTYEEFSLQTSSGKTYVSFKSKDSVVIFVPSTRGMMSIAISNLHQVEKLSEAKLIELVDSISYPTSTP